MGNTRPAFDLRHSRADRQGCGLVASFFGFVLTAIISVAAAIFGHGFVLLHESIALFAIFAVLLVTFPDEDKDEPL